MLPAGSNQQATHYQWAPSAPLRHRRSIEHISAASPPLPPPLPHAVGMSLGQADGALPTEAAEGKEEVDELDALLASYEQQAAADADAVQQRQQRGGAGAKRRKLSVNEKREEALSQPIGTDNKCEGRVQWQWQEGARCLPQPCRRW